MALARCPECGRVADGVACFACGYEWPAEASGTAEAKDAAPAPAPADAPPAPADASPLAFGASTPAPLSDPMAEAGLEFDFSDDGPLDGAAEGGGAATDGFDIDGDLASLSAGFDVALEAGGESLPSDLTEPLDRAALAPPPPNPGPPSLDSTEPIEHREITKVLGTPDPTEQLLRVTAPPDVGLAAAAPQASVVPPPLPEDEALPYGASPASIDVNFDPFAGVDEASALPSQQHHDGLDAINDLPDEDIDLADIDVEGDAEPAPAFDPFFEGAAPAAGFDPFADGTPAAPPPEARELLASAAAPSPPPVAAPDAFDPFGLDAAPVSPAAPAEVGLDADEFDPFGVDVAVAPPPAPAEDELAPFGIDVAAPAPPPAPVADELDSFGIDVAAPAPPPAQMEDEFDPFGAAPEADASDDNFDPFADFAGKPGKMPPAPPPDDDLDLSLEADASADPLADLPDLDDLPDVDPPSPTSLDDLPDLDDLDIDEELAAPPAPGLSDRVGVLAEQLEVEGRVIEASLLYEVQAVLSSLGR